MTSPQNPHGQSQPGPPAPGGAQQPPPIANPYGPPSAAPQPPAQQPAPGGWGPYPAAAAPKRQRDAQPGKFTWWDLGAFLFYVLGFLTGLVGLIGLLPPVNQMLASEDEGTAQFGLFLINAISYGGLALMALLLSGQALWRSVKAFAYLWWLKLLLIPVGWFAMMVLNVVIVFFGFSEEPETSENQLAIEAMLGAVPFWAAVVVIAMLGPYVEEYFFRHLLIGKLSRHLNVWICGAISVVTFPLLHFLPALVGLADDLSLVSVVPYMTMGILITVGYIVAGRNLFYAWLLHAFNNFISLALAYFVQPWAEDVLDDFENLEGGLAVLGVFARILG